MLALGHMHTQVATGIRPVCSAAARMYRNPPQRATTRALPVCGRAVMRAHAHGRKHTTRPCTSGMISTRVPAAPAAAPASRPQQTPGKGAPAAEPLVPPTVCCRCGFFVPRPPHSMLHMMLQLCQAASTILAVRCGVAHLRCGLSIQV